MYIFVILAAAICEQMRKDMVRAKNWRTRRIEYNTKLTIN